MAVFVWVSAADAKTLYVNNSGSPACSDSTTYANNLASAPWCTIGRAAWGSTDWSAPNTSEAAAAGDTVLITAGTYTTENYHPNNARAVSYNPANSGTSESPITFRGVGRVTLQSTGNGSALIGAGTRNYIIWDNFYLDETNIKTWAGAGPVAFSGTGNQALNLEIKCVTPTWWDHETNHAGIYLEPADNTTIQNCKIYGVVATDGTLGQNAAAVMMYDSNDNIIENNEFYDCGVGVFVKGIHDPLTQDGNTIRKNLIYGMGHSGIRLLSARYSKVYQNIVRDSEVGVYFGFFSPTGDLVVNNTLVDNVLGIQLQGNDMVDEGVYNNIIYGSTSFAIESKDDPNDPSGQDVAYNYNLYYSNYRHAQYNTYGTPTLTLTYSQWQDPWGMDVNGSNSDPLFVAYASDNYKLQVGSPALTLGRTITGIHGSSGETIPAGAYITGNETIGIETTTSSRKLNNVTGVRVNLY